MSMNTFPSTIIAFTVVMLITGVVMGLIIRDVELTRPLSAAEQSNPSGQQRALELSYYWQQQQAKLGALEAKYQREMAQAEERHHLELASIERRTQLVNTLLIAVAASLALGVLMASSGAAYYLVCLGRSRQAAGLVHNWGNDGQRALAVRQAREAELRWRAAQQHALQQTHQRGRTSMPATRQSCLRQIPDLKFQV